jgi:putative addiction module component (TIGR02574 family)
MTHTAERIRDEALQLTPEERLRLAQDLHDSVLTPEEREIQQAWVDVAEQRYEEWKAGRATMHSAEDVLGELRVKYGQNHRNSRRG